MGDAPRMAPPGYLDFELTVRREAGRSESVSVAVVQSRAGAGSPGRPPAPAGVGEHAAIQTTSTAGSTPRAFALLIGVDCYLPGRLPSGEHYPSLGGCVRDITHVKEFLRSRLNLPDERILMLTATNTGAAQPPEPPERWPTYENMVAAFQRLTEMAQPGDQVYVHYSGHGGRAPTLLPERKGPDGIDETLVPADIHRPAARYLRDVELGPICQRLVEKGVQLSVVLDSCHSGGAVRGSADVAVRGIGVVDRTPRSQESLVGSPRELADAWQRLSATVTRTVTGGSGWLPEPEGYVLLAACRPTESAFEFAFNGKERNGALTYWLLDTVRAHGTGLTYQMLHDRIVAKVHSQFSQQTPQLQGEGQTVFLGGSAGAAPPTAPVLQVEAGGTRVRLGVGQAAGVLPDAEFAVYPFGTIDFQDKTARQAIVTVREVGATDCLAEVTTSLRRGAIAVGAPALLINPGTMRLSRCVGFARPQDLPAGIDKTAAEEAFQAVRAALKTNLWVTEAEDGDTVELQVALAEAGHGIRYEIWDGAGVPLPNLPPSVAVSAAGAAERVVWQLEHLARFRAIEHLECYEPASPLHGSLVVELAGVQDRYVRGQRPNPRPFADAGGSPTLDAGQWTFLRIRNESAQALNIAVLDLQPDWGITQVYPGAQSDFVQIEAGKELPLIALQADLPDGYAEGRDILKVLASVGPANFRMLTLPALDAPPVRSAKRRAAPKPSNPLEALMSAFAADRPATRTVKAVADPSTEWTTAAVELRVRRPTARRGPS